MKDYTGKTIYLGIDVHKKTYAVTAICEGVVIKKATLQANPEGLVSFCKKFFPKATIESAYEAGFSGFYLHRILEKNNIKNLVVHAAGIEVAIGDRVKTDKRDSLKIAVQLAAHRLKGIHVPSEEREEQRVITRARTMIVEHRTSVGSQIKALLHQQGLITPTDKSKICPKWIENLKKLPIREGFRYVLNHLVDLWLTLTKKIQEINIEIAKQATCDTELEAVYRSAPGIGPLGSRILANELKDMSHFENERQLFSYTGLTPSEHSSGGYVRRGHISRQGNVHVRRIAVLAAWMAIRKDPYLKMIFDRIAKKAGSKKAIVAIARKLLGRIRACLRQGCLYKIGALSVSSEAA